MESTQSHTHAAKFSNLSPNRSYMKAIEHIVFLTTALLAISAPAESAEKPTTLKETFKDHFLVGTAVNRSMVTGGGGFRRSPEQTAKDIALLKVQFNQITAENDMKWAL